MSEQAPPSVRQTLQELQLRGPGSTQGEADPLAPAARYRKISGDLHRQLLDRIDLEAMGRLPPERLREELRGVVDLMIDEAGIALSAGERKQVIADVQNEVMGLGPIEGLLVDPSISDILVNTHRTVYVERFGRLELTGVRFSSDAHLLKIIDRIVSRVGRRIDESSPMVDARLPDGSRVNAIIPPLAIDGPLLSIRRFAVVPLRIDDLVSNGTLTPAISELLAGMVRARLNIVISGGTGTGKTTLLNILSGFIPDSERIITIEDAAELQLQQRHVVRLETRPPNLEGRGEVTQRALVRNSLRMRPDRIILGEVRGPETFDMLQAMNTGHEGSMVTVHANSPRDALIRLENMLGMAGVAMSPKAVRQQIASAITAVIQIARLSDGRRRIVSLQEVTGMEGEMLSMQEVFDFQQTGVAPDGSVQGRFRATGIRPRFLQRLKAFGVTLGDDLFDPREAG